MVAVCEQQFDLHDICCDVLGDGDVSSNERFPSASSLHERESLPSSECDNNFSPAVIFYAA